MINYTNNIVCSTLNVKCYPVVCWLVDIERRRHNYAIHSLSVNSIPLSRHETMAHVYWVTIQLARDVDAGLANIRTTSRRDITNPPVTLIQYTALMSRPHVYSHAANVL